MKYLIDTLPDPIGRRPLDEKDFYAICEQERITVIWHGGRKAFRFSVLDRPFIALPKRLNGLKLLFAAFHELGHHFLSAGDPVEVAWLGMDEDDREELECNAVALVAIIPRSHLHRIDEILDLWPPRFARELRAERLRLYFLYGV